MFGSLPPHRLSNAVIPCAIVDSRFHVVHPGWIGIGFTTFPKNRRVEQHVGDVIDLVILDLDFIVLALSVDGG